MREVDARLLEYGAVAEHSRLAAAAFGPLPAIVPETRLAVFRLESLADSILQVAQIGEHSISVGPFHESGFYCRAADFLAGAFFFAAVFLAVAAVFLGAVFAATFIFGSVSLFAARFAFAEAGAG